MSFRDIAIFVTEAIAHIDSLISRPALFGWMCQILFDCHAKDNRRKSRSAEAPDNETVAAAVGFVMVSGSIRLCERLGWDLSWCQALCVASIRDIGHFVSAESSFLTSNDALGRQIFRSGTCVSRPDAL